MRKDSTIEGVFMVAAAISSGFTSFVEVSHSLVLDSDGFKKVAYLALSIFELMEKTASTIHPALPILTEHFTAFTHAAVFVALAARIKDWTCHDDDNKMFWQRSWQSVASTACLTASQILTCIGFFDTLKIIKLDRAVTHISNASSILMAGCCAFDVWCNVHTLQKIATIRTKAIARNRTWNERAQNIPADGILPEVWTRLLTSKIAKWNQKEHDMTLDAATRARASKKRLEWEGLQNCPDVQSIKNYCLAKAGKWTTVRRNQKIERAKTWLTIAVNVSFIALIIIGLVATIPTTGALMLSVALFSIAANAGDILNFLLGLHLKTSTPEVPVPRAA